MRFSIAHLLWVMTASALLTVLCSTGEIGWSLIPVFMLPSLLVFLARMRWRRCPKLLKLRYHVVLVLLLCPFLVIGWDQSFGWWRLPVSYLLVFFVCPATLIALQLTKAHMSEEPNLELRLGQLAAIWLPTTMILISFLYNAI